MSGETEQTVSAWTTDTLHSHMEVQFVLLREQLDRQWDTARREAEHHLAGELRAVDVALRSHDEALRVARETSKEAITAALSAQKEAVQVAQAATKEAAQIAATTADKRAESMNEWRASLNDVLTRAMPREEAKAAIDRAAERIQELGTLAHTMVPRAEHEVVVQRLAERIDELTVWRNRVEGAGLGKKENIAGLYAALGGAVALIAIIVFAANALFAGKG